MRPGCREVCDDEALARGEAVHFEAFVRGELRRCVAVRAPDGTASAFLNVCAHRNQPVVVDEHPLSESGLLECRAHGALYDPTTGACVDGPCTGAQLVVVPLIVEDGRLLALDDDAVDDSIYE